MLYSSYKSNIDNICLDNVVGLADMFRSNSYPLEDRERKAKEILNKGFEGNARKLRRYEKTSKESNILKKGKLSDIFPNLKWNVSVSNICLIEQTKLSLSNAILNPGETLSFDFSQIKDDNYRNIDALLRYFLVTNEIPEFGWDADLVDYSETLLAFLITIFQLQGMLNENGLKKYKDLIYSYTGSKIYKPFKFWFSKSCFESSVVVEENSIIFKIKNISPNPVDIDNDIVPYHCSFLGDITMEYIVGNLEFSISK